VNGRNAWEVSAEYVMLRGGDYLLYVTDSKSVAVDGGLGGGG
jgi:hypothetical protein